MALEGALVILFGASCAHAATAASAGGCLLGRHEAGSYLTDAQTGVPTRDDIVLRSGNSDFDYALAQTLSLLVDSFEVLPGFGFYKVGDVRNAYSSPLRHLERHRRYRAVR